MGNSVIWYLPSGAAFMERIDFGRRISDRVGPTPLYSQVVQQSLSSAQSTVIHHGLSVLSIRHVWQRDAAGTGDALRRKLATLSAHLRAGGSMVFVEDEALAFAGIIVTGKDPGTDEFSVEVNLFQDLATGTPDCSGREVVINSDFDRYRWEMLECDVHIGDGLSLTTGIVQDFEGARWAMVREWGSWPALRVPLERRNDEFVHHDSDRVFRLDLPLEEDVSQIEALEASGIPLFGTEPGPNIIVDFDPETPTPKGMVYGWKRRR